MVFWSGNACTIADPSAPIGMPHHGSGKWRDEKEEGEREVGRERERKGGEGRERGQVSGLSTSFRDQSLRLTGRKRERERKGEGKSRGKKTSSFFYF